MNDASVRGAWKESLSSTKLIVYGDLSQLTMATGQMKGQIDHVKPTNRPELCLRSVLPSENPRQ